MTLRELINQVTDNDSESSVLDYELTIFRFDNRVDTTKFCLVGVQYDTVTKEIHMEINEK